LILVSQQHKDLFSTLINQFWRLISGPITLLLIPLFLSQEQQGYWYLFGSLSALSVFADLGFSNIVLQFAAHEFAFLHFNKKGFLEGENYYLQKLGSFFRFVIKWISAICSIVFPLIYIIGILFFIRDNVVKIYFLPWTIYSVSSLIKFITDSALSFVEGLNKIAIIQNIRFFAAIINTVIVIITLIIGGNIYALAFGMLLSSFFLVISIFNRFRNVLKMILDIAKGFKYNWRSEIIPLFVKYAISFSSGFFIFQIYTPLMHYFHGPIYSGKVGITLALVTTVFSLSNIWMYTITPKMNMLISQKLWDELNNLFYKRLLLSLGSYLFIIVGLISFLLLFGNYWIIPKIVSRFLPVTSMVILFFGYFLQLPMGAWALYLRGHKQEPYAIISLITAVWTIITTLLIGKLLPYNWFFLGFLSGCVFIIPFNYQIFKKYKGKWHAE
jgi:O-antigen/teichoic acid export membrane protein